ncbi:ribonuclease HII [Sporosarcina sp. 179-K 3D1 HS]|uniref:ribonuclease HII n=1 Tax=Sporosarcina sp. 179-K 3D1 HS TaxID=3232169 RepID=UPI0039A2C74E
MSTIKEIVERLQATEEREDWMRGLHADPRAGVRAALHRWERQYEKKKKIREEHDRKCAFDMAYAPYDGALVAGVDEAGRGPLAGPVVTAAVILPKETPELVGLDDSKAIQRVERERLAQKIREVAIAYSIHTQPVNKIDEMNIYAATRDSMEQAVKGLVIQPDIVLADAMALTVPCQTESIVKGDAQSLAIAAASILAKTTRDALMDELHERYSVYQFGKNAGYGTAEHLEALHLYGPCDQHRASFEPIKTMLKGRRQDLGLSDQDAVVRTSDSGCLSKQAATAK